MRVYFYSKILDEFKAKSVTEKFYVRNEPSKLSLEFSMFGNFWILKTDLFETESLAVLAISEAIETESIIEFSFTSLIKEP